MTPESLLADLQRKKRNAALEVTDATASVRRAQQELADTTETIESCRRNGLPAAHIAIVEALVDPDRRVVAAHCAAESAAGVQHTAAQQAVDDVGHLHAQLQVAGAAGTFYQNGQEPPPSGDRHAGGGEPPTPQPEPPQEPASGGRIWVEPRPDGVELVLTAADGRENRSGTLAPDDAREFAQFLDWAAVEPIRHQRDRRGVNSAHTYGNDEGPATGFAMVTWGINEPIQVELLSTDAYVVLTDEEAQQLAARIRAHVPLPQPPSGAVPGTDTHLPLPAQVRYDRESARIRRLLDWLDAHPPEVWEQHPEWRELYDTNLAAIRALNAAAGESLSNEAVRRRPYGALNPWPRDEHGAITDCTGVHGGEFRDDPTLYWFVAEPLRPGQRKRHQEWRAFCRFCGHDCGTMTGMLAPGYRERSAMFEKSLASRPHRWRSHVMFRRRDSDPAERDGKRHHFGSGRRRKPVPVPVQTPNTNPYGRAGRHDVADARVYVRGRWDHSVTRYPDGEVLWYEATPTRRMRVRRAARRRYKRRGGRSRTG